MMKLVAVIVGPVGTSQARDPHVSAITAVASLHLQNRNQYNFYLRAQRLCKYCNVKLQFLGTEFLL